MLHLILNSYTRNHSLLHRLADDVDDGAISEQPAPGMNHPAWILGHLAWASDVGCKLMGLPTGLPDDWPSTFDKRSRPRAERTAYPEKARLVAAYDEAHARFARAWGELPPEVLDRPIPDERLRKLVPTIGDALVHLATAHESLHIGQLSAWRRARGLPPIPMF